MSFGLQWTDRARTKFWSALAFIAEENPLNAQRVKERTHRTITNLESFSLGLPAPAGTHKIYIPKTPYFVVFRRGEDGNINICGFVHASRDWEIYDWENL
jgi:plasmid stabilization system protein ParE